MYSSLIQKNVMTLHRSIYYHIALDINTFTESLNKNSLNS